MNLDGMQKCHYQPHSIFHKWNRKKSSIEGLKKVAPVCFFTVAIIFSYLKFDIGDHTIHLLPFRPNLMRIESNLQCLWMGAVIILFQVCFLSTAQPYCWQTKQLYQLSLFRPSLNLSSLLTGFLIFNAFF